MDAVTTVQKEIAVYINPDETVDAQQTAFESVASYVVKHSMQDLIELLEDKLISEDDRERNRATTLLADIFHHQKLPLGASVIHLYVVFFSHRLSDYPSIIPSLHALTGLIQLYQNEFDPKYMDALDIFQSVFRSVPVASYPQTVRFKVLLLFKALLDNQNFIPSLEAQGAEILDGLVGCTEEEKDPRCLQQVFTLMHVAIKVFWKSLGARVSLPQPEQDNEGDAMDVQAGAIDEAYTTMLLSARLFDALSCYFPITFTPPPNDPFGITPEGLISALEDCLCSYLGPLEASLSTEDSSVAAKRKLEPYAASADGNAIVRLSVPFFIEQLTTDMHIAKIHALRALTRIVRTNPLRHRVFGLLSATANEGSSGGGGTTSKRVSAEDAQLYAMVEDGDADYSDLYVQDSTSDDAPAIATTPQQRLQQSLQQLSMDVYNLSTDQETMPEHLAELQMHALTFTGELCRALDAELVTGNRTSWDAFAAPMLDKILSELSADANSAKAKSAVDIAYVIARVGGGHCCAEVLHKLAPFLLRYAVNTHTSVTGAVQRGAQDTLRGVDRVLNLAAVNKSTSQRGATINSEDGKLAVGLEMLAQLIACVGPQSGSSVPSIVSLDHSHSHSHAHSHAHSGGGGCGHDHGAEKGHSCGGGAHTTSPAGASHDHAHGHSHNSSHIEADVVANISALHPYAAQLFDALFVYTCPTQVETPQNIGSAVNPFAAVRTAFAEDRNEAVTGDVMPIGDAGTVVPVLAVPAPAVLAIVGSISAMKELLSRCPLEQLSADKISAYVSNITHLAVHGLPYLFVTNPAVLSVENSAAGEPQSPAQVLHRSCVSFLVSLCRLRNNNDSTSAGASVAADEILKRHCVAPLLSVLAERNGSSAVSVTERRALEVLSALGRECSMHAMNHESSLLALIVPQRMTAIEACVTTVVDSAAVSGERLVLALQTLVDVLDPLPDSSTSNDNQLKAVYLLRSVGGRTSAVQHLLQLLHRNMDALVAQPGTALPVLEHSYTLLRRVMLALPTVLQTAHAMILVQALLLQAEASAPAATATNGNAFTVGALVNVFVYLDKGSALWGAGGQGLVQRCCEFGWLQLNTTASNALPAATVFRAPSVADFSAAQLIAVLANQVQDDEQCERILQRSMHVFSAAVQAESTDFTVPVEQLLWLSKSLSMRPNLKLKLKISSQDWVVSGATSSGLSDLLLSAFPADAALPATWQEYLVALLLHLLTYESAYLSASAEDKEVVRRLQLALASQMSVLTADHELILSSTVRATATTAALFWKQKLWNRLFSKLSSSGPSSTSTAGTNESPFTAVLRMLSVCALSTGVSVNIMQDSLAQLVSVVVTAMSYRPSSNSSNADSAVKESVTYIGACAVLSQQSMCTLEVLLKHDAQLFIPYLNIVMPALMETSLSTGSAKLRATALEGLLSITEHVPYARLFPFKALVSKGLVRALDDKKKAVRVLAGRVRNKWIVMK